MVAHIRQCLLNLKMALLQQLPLKVQKKSKASFEGKYFAVEDHVVPYATSNLEIYILYKDSHEPVSQEEGCVDFKTLEMLV